MLELALPLWADILIFAVSALAIGVAGTVLSGATDRLADRSGMGEALLGILLLGGVTSLPGLAASVTAALDGNAAIAVSNAMGGIAFQTTILAVADIVYRRANLEHAAASVENMLQTALLVALLTLVSLILVGPDIRLGHVHVGTPILVMSAAAGYYLVYRARAMRMWQPTETDLTVLDVPDPDNRGRSTGQLVGRLVAAAAVVIPAGALVATTAGEIAEATGLSATVAGGLFTAVATSLPELVTTTSAVQRGALTLAVANIVGGNFFDVLFVAFADVAYLPGSVYHAQDVTGREVFLTGVTILVNVVLLVGLIFRQRVGPARIGFESMAILLIYLAGLMVTFLFM